MGTAPIVELARAYGLHPRLWLLGGYGKESSGTGLNPETIKAQAYSVRLSLSHEAKLYCSATERNSWSKTINF